MYVLMVNVKVKPEHRNAFIDAITDNAIGSNTHEDGCLRFDVVQHNDDPDRFFFYEIYKSYDELEAHRSTAHFKRYAQLSPDFLAEPPIRIGGTNLYPNDDIWR